MSASSEATGSSISLKGNRKNVEEPPSSSFAIPKTPSKGKAKVSGVGVSGCAKGVGAVSKVVELIGASELLSRTGLGFLCIPLSSLSTGKAWEFNPSDVTDSLLVLRSWAGLENLGIHPELGADDRRVLLTFRDWKLERYSTLTNHSKLIKLGFSPVVVRIKTPVPISVARAECSSSMESTSKDHMAKVALLRKTRSRNKCKTEVGSGSDSASPANAVHTFFPQETRLPSSGGTSKQSIVLIFPSSTEVERALEIVSHILLGSAPPYPTERSSPLLPKVSKSEKGKLPNSETDLEIEKEKIQSKGKHIKEELGKTEVELRHRTDEWFKISRESLEALSSYRAMKSEYDVLAETSGILRNELKVQWAAAQKKDDLIAKLDDDITTQWATNWLTFQDKAELTYPSLDFNFEISTEEETEAANVEASVLTPFASKTVHKGVEVPIPPAEAPARGVSSSIVISISSSPVTTPTLTTRDPSASAVLVAQAPNLTLPIAKVEVSIIPAAPELLEISTTDLLSSTPLGVTTAELLDSSLMETSTIGLPGSSPPIHNTES
ncbi:unnamed protein product [Ilex paraguariensis]|uniref:Uncharacterized protein n=1 Tax=Ilex paraguariensis TaxID=185542 RepID=A0ABC8SPP8_9AQUA